MRVQVNVLRKGVGANRCDNVCGHVNIVDDRAIPVDGASLRPDDCGVTDGIMCATWTPILTKTTSGFELSINEKAIQSDGICQCVDEAYPPCSGATANIKTC